MDKTVDKMVESLTQAFNLGAKQVQDLYPVVKAQWLRYSILDLPLAISLIVVVAFATFILLLVFMDEVKLREKYLKPSLKVLVISCIIALVVRILQYCFASDYMMFLQLTGN